MKTVRSFVLATLSFSLVLGGCAVQAADDSTASSQAASSATHKLVGSWESTGPDQLLYYAFTFNADKTYSATGGCNPNATPHCFAITESQGTWKLGRSGPELGDPAGAAEIVLDDQFNQKTTYFYSVTSTTLSLSTAYEGQTSKFTKESAPPVQNACEVAGGSCVALYPGSCANGTVVDANTYSCGGGLGVECCMPNSNGNDAGPVQGNDAGPVQGQDAGSCEDAGSAQCQSDSDCSGILPQSCEVCSDGSASCAHWSCQAGQCTIAYCN